MNITEKTISILEFDKIRESLAACALTGGAAELAHSLSPTDRYEEICRRQRRTTDAKKMMSVKGTPPISMLSDITDAVERADKGAVLTPRELMNVESLLRTARNCIDYAKTNLLEDNVMDELFGRLTANKKLENDISRIIVSEDMISDDASPKLSDIRRRMRGISVRIREILQKYTSGGAYTKALQENIVTTRNGRYVIPVKTEYKNEIKGLVHDTSSSGATLFVEPMAVVEANNELRELEGAEKNEIDRILSELSAAVAENADTIVYDYHNINDIAFIFACAQLSYDMKASAPMLRDERVISLSRARHPLLDKEKVVPISVDMSGGFDTLVITGPNTGGKTVTLKTLGLLTIMAQSGLHIPADDSSVCGCFSEVLADIGDEQSIEQSLSTFSAHMVNIVSVMKHCGPRSLVLFDELGAGTDPIEGAALATAILEKVKESGALCAATTHYAELKAYALDTKGVCNASCEFDIETLRPTYRLLMGTPGKSNAFAIAGKLGIDPDVISRASSLIDKDSRRFENVIEKLEGKRADAEKRAEELEKMRAELASFKEESERRIREVQTAAEKEAEKAKEQARRMIEGARASSNYVLDELEKLRRRDAKTVSESEIEKTRRAFRESLARGESSITPELETPEDDGYVLLRPLKKGDKVVIRSIGKEGIVVSDPDRDGKVRVQAGRIITNTDTKNLRLAQDKIPEKKKPIISSHRLTVSHDFSPELDLRGQIGDDAWRMCDKYIDDAMVAGVGTVRIIHGKGTGALRRYLWECFRGDMRIKSYRQGQYGEGDSGVTVLELA